MITYNTFLNYKSFDDFKDNKKINMDNFNEIISFFNCCYDGAVKPFYHCNPLYNTITKTNNYQYMVINFENDVVFFMYKIIQIVTTKQIRVFDLPISKNNNQYNVKKIINHLNQLSFVKFATQESFIQDEYGINYVGNICEYNDYYFDLNNLNFNSKFKSSNRINLLENNLNFKVYFTSEINKEDALTLRKQWKEDKLNVNKTSDNIFEKFLNYSSDDLRYILIYYKNKLISLQCFLINNNLEYADCLYIIHLGRQKNNDETLSKILSSLTNIQIFLISKYFCNTNINYIYLAGCRPTEKKLLQHKKRISSGAIKYYISSNK